MTAQNPAVHARGVSYRRVVVWIVAVVVGLATVVGWGITERSVETRFNEYAEYKVEDARLAIVRSMQEYENVLLGVSASLMSPTR